MSHSELRISLKRRKGGIDIPSFLLPCRCWRMFLFDLVESTLVAVVVCRTTVLDAFAATATTGLIAAPADGKKSLKLSSSSFRVFFCSSCPSFHFLVVFSFFFTI